MYNPFEHLRRAIHRAKNAERRDRYAKKIREARRTRDEATATHDRDFHRFRIDCYRNYVKFFCEPNNL